MSDLEVASAFGTESISNPLRLEIDVIARADRGLVDDLVGALGSFSFHGSIGRRNTGIVTRAPAHPLDTLRGASDYGRPMVVVWGKRMSGKIDRLGATHVATSFGHIYWLPIIPLGSTLVLAQEGNQYHGIPIGLNLRSMLAGYLRSWGVIAAIALLFSAIGSFARADAGTLLVQCAEFVAVAGLSTWAWVALGQLSADERGQRLVYHDFSGYPIDVAQMGEAREPLRQKLNLHVVECARGLASRGYRMEGTSATSWQELAKHPTVIDAAFLRAALTLARLEWSLAGGATRMALAEVHRVVWEKLRRVDPSVMETKAT